MNLSHIFIFLSLLLFFIVPVSATFEDDFNDDNLGEWTLYSYGGGSSSWSTASANNFSGLNNDYYGYGSTTATTSGGYQYNAIDQDIGALYQYYTFDLKFYGTCTTGLYHCSAEFQWQSYNDQYTTNRPGFYTNPNYGLHFEDNGANLLMYETSTANFNIPTATIGRNEWNRVYVALTSTQIRVRVYNESLVEVYDQTVAYTQPNLANGGVMRVGHQACYDSSNRLSYLRIDNIKGWDEWPGIGILTVPSDVIINEVVDITYSFSEYDFTNFDYFVYVYTPSGALTSYTLTSATPEIFEYNTAGRSEGTYAVYLVGKSLSTGEAYVMDYKEMILNSTVEAYGYTIDATTWTNLSSTNVSYYQALTYHNTTSDVNGFYLVDDLLVDYLIHINATKVNYTHDDFSVTPTFSYNNSVDLYLFPTNRTLNGTSIVEGMTVNYPWHQGIGGATVNIYNSTWSNTTTSNIHGYYIFNLSTLVNGTYTVNATLSGYENSTEYDVTVVKNESTVQNIVLNKKYILTVTAIDAATSSPLSTFTTTVDGTQTLTTNGTTTHSLDYGLYLVSVGADDYISASEYALMIMDRSVELSLSRYSDDQGGIYYPYHFVKFTVQNVWGTKYNGVDVSVYEGTDTTTTFAGTTGSDGSVTFKLSETTQYRITFIDSAEGISETRTLYPVDDHYYIIVSSTLTDWNSYDIPISDAIDFTISKSIINSTHSYINVTYSDSLAETTDLKVYLNQTNESDYFNQTNLDTWSPGGINSGTHSYIVSPYVGESFFIHLVVQHTTYGEIDSVYSISFADDISSKFPGLPPSIWLYGSIFILLFTGGIFVRTNVEKGMLVVCIMFFIFYGLGTFASLPSNVQQSMLAGGILGFILSIIANLNKSNREEGFT